MSARTRTALAGLDAADPSHLSAQLDDDMVTQATLIAVFEPMHVSYVRKKHPRAADRVASLSRLARDLAPGAPATLGERVQTLALQDHVFEPWEEVIDPAGGDLAVFESAAAEILELIDTFGTKVGIS